MVIANGLAAILYMISYVLFGVAVIRTATLSRWSGVLVPVEDRLAFAAAIRRLANDPSLRQRMGAAAAAHVRARHDVPVAAAALDAILRRVVRARHPLESTRTS